MFNIDLKTLEECDFKTLSKKNVVQSLEETNLYTNFASEGETAGHLIESLVRSKYQQLVLENNLVPSCHVAAFVIGNQESPQDTYVVSLASGSKCNMSRKPDGTRVHDCHAATLARRGLLLFFYQQLYLLSDPIKSSMSIFVKQLDDEKKVILRDNYKFHLYVSSVPPGDASADPYDENLRVFRTYAKDGISTVATRKQWGVEKVNNFFVIYIFCL